MNDTCEIVEGQRGWCLPDIHATVDASGSQHRTGLCVDRSGLAPNSPCLPSPLDEITDRSEPGCTLGLCFPLSESDGFCARFCDWEAAYDVAVLSMDASMEVLPCPEGSNCFSADGLGANYDDRLGSASVCIPRALETTCSLVTNQLLAEPHHTCEDVEPRGRCVVAEVRPGQRADATLVGICRPGSSPGPETWSACDPVLDSERCPAGTECRPDHADPASELATPRCVPWCDLRAHSAEGACASLGAPSETRCVSLLPNPWSPPRLGACVQW